MNHNPGKKGYPRFQHDNRSVEYKQTGWKLSPDGKHITFTDGCGIGTLWLVGNKKQRVEAFPINQIKRVRLVRRGDGYDCQFSVEAERTVKHEPSGRQAGRSVLTWGCVPTLPIRRAIPWIPHAPPARQSRNLSLTRFRRVVKS